MRKNNVLIPIILTGILLISCSNNNNNPTPAPPLENNPDEDIPKVEEMILDPEEWKEKYPLVYESFMKSSTMGDNVAENLI